MCSGDWMVFVIGDRLLVSAYFAFLVSECGSTTSMIAGIGRVPSCMSLVDVGCRFEDSGVCWDAR